MPSTEITVRVGQSDNIDFQLLNDIDNDGVAETPINLSGVDHCEFVLINKSTGGTTTYQSGTAKFQILSGTSGSVRFIPDGTADLNLTSAGKVNIYSGYVWVYSTSAKKYSVPETHEINIHVRP